MHQFWIMFLIIISCSDGQKPYNPLKDHCCFGTVTPMTNSTSPFFSCCGNVSYDSETQQCCRSKSVNVVQPYVGPDNRVLMCCGLQAVPVNPKRFCCNGKMMDKPKSKLAYDNFACCGDKPYSTFGATCIGDTIVNITVSNNMASCDQKIYDRKTQTCCSGKIHNVTVRVPTIADLGFQLAGLENLPFSIGSSHNFPFGYQCCGTEVYDVGKDMCCYGTEISSVIPLPDNNTCAPFMCCGGKPVGPQQQCCNGEIFFPTLVDKYNFMPSKNNLKSTPKVTQCCIGGGIVQDPDTEMCCPGGGVIPIERPDQSCCGGVTAYDSRTHICCGSKVHPIPNYEADCCGDEPYTHKNQFCCGGVVYSITDERNECCELNMGKDVIYQQTPVVYKGK